MKDLTLRIFDKLAVKGQPRGKEAGAFQMPSPHDQKLMRIIASTGLGWDHVSVSRPDRVPDWYEMEAVKRLFFWPTETAMQLHVPPADHINNHENCLHLWRPLDVEIPRPPGFMVGVKDMTHRIAAGLGVGVFDPD